MVPKAPVEVKETVGIPVMVWLAAKPAVKAADVSVMTKESPAPPVKVSVSVNVRPVALNVSAPAPPSNVSAPVVSDQTINKDKLLFYKDIY